LRHEVVRIESWESFLSIIGESPYQNWAFRGQKDASSQLFSGLSRYLMAFAVDPRAWIEQEERILRIFKRKASLILDIAPDLDDDFAWLALMQDHGAPTRLLDFTWSPYVAAFFALHDTTEAGVIWACNPVELEKVKRLSREPRDGFRKHILSKKDNFVWLGEPYAMNSRLIAQSGTFLVPGALDQSIEQIVKGYPNPRNTLIKFILPADRVREKGMRELYKMNIRQSTLFPDLDGLARSLAYELEFHWAYDPRTMKKRVADRQDLRHLKHSKRAS
jgi:hypothetical protein